MKRQKSVEISRQKCAQRCPLSLYDEEDFASYIRGKMPAANAERLVRHLESCEECRVVLLEYSKGEEKRMIERIAERSFKMLDELK